MKNIILTVIIFTNYSFSAFMNKREIIKLIKEIKEERIGISSNKLERTPNPFAIKKIIEKEEIIVNVPKSIEIPKELDEKEEKEEEEVIYILSAVMNKSVLINGKWYKEGDIIETLKVTNITKISVILERDEYKKILFFKTDKKMDIKLEGK